MEADFTQQIKLVSPEGIVFNTLDYCIYACDSKDVVRRITKSGEITNFAVINEPRGIAHYEKENCLFVSSFETHQIYKITSSGQVSTYAGSVLGYLDGPAATAKFNYPNGIAVDQETGILYVADSSNNVIRQITAEGEVITVAGCKGEGDYVDGYCLSARFNDPSGIFLSPEFQCIFVCDQYNDALRKISFNGIVSTVCDIECPLYVCVLSNGRIIVSTDEKKVCNISLNGNDEIQEFGESGKKRNVDGHVKIMFTFPAGITVDISSKICYVVDNNRIVPIQYY